MAEAVRVLEAGGLICFPTDTLFAVACAAELTEARRRLYRAKQRDQSQPAILMVADSGGLDRWVEIDRRASALMDEFWPGPLTLILRATGEAVARLGSLVLDGTLGVRIPNHEIAREVLVAAGGPLATSSANQAAKPPPTTGAEATTALGEQVALVIDGDCPLGEASSILDLTGASPRLLREGAIPAARFF